MSCQGHGGRPSLGEQEVGVVGQVLPLSTHQHRKNAWFLNLKPDRRLMTAGVMDDVGSYARNEGGLEEEIVLDAGALRKAIACVTVVAPQGRVHEHMRILLPWEARPEIDLRPAA